MDAGLSADVATRETVNFVLPFVRRWRSPRVLEIGCGSGELAEVLQAQGCRVTALDSSEEAVTAARARGVEAHLATWPQFDGGPFELVLFTRSLHHITPLDAAVAKAHALLTDDGALLVEDFAFDEMGEWTASWFHELLRTLVTSGVVIDLETFAGQLLKSGKGLDAWLADHDHELHTAAAMKEAIGSVFGKVEMTNAPYLYRYVRQAVDAAKYRDVIDAVWHLEVTTGHSQPGLLIGRRLVAEKR